MAKGREERLARNTPRADRCGVRVRVQAMVAELTKKLSACQAQLSTAQERCSQLDKEKQQAVSDLQSTRQVSVTAISVTGNWSACLHACTPCVSLWSRPSTLYLGCWQLT